MNSQPVSWQKNQAIADRTLISPNYRKPDARTIFVAYEYPIHSSNHTIYLPDYGRYTFLKLVAPKTQHIAPRIYTAHPTTASSEFSPGVYGLGRGLAGRCVGPARSQPLPSALPHKVQCRRRADFD